VVDLADGALVGTASHRTTVDSDVLHGLDAAVAEALAGRTARIGPDQHYVCSSAGGGLRLAVVGNEPLVTAEAGHRVGLSAGARVVSVSGGRLDQAGLADLRSARPDVLLLVGGTDGGDEEVLRHNAARLGAARLSTGRQRLPVVLAGNVEARADATELLTARGVPVIPTDNVLPRIGELNPGPARLAIREVFLRHVIGGKRLSRGPRFASLIRGATPDVVLTAAELLAEHLDGDLLVVDVGGATTDVYSVLREEQPSRDVAGTLWHSRTVEGDLGMRWNAAGVVTAALAERLLTPGAAAGLAEAAARRVTTPGLLARTAQECAEDATLARLAAVTALRRHARGDAGGDRGSGGRGGGRDLRGVRLLVGSGGVLRHSVPASARDVLAAVLADHAGGWLLPRAADSIVDSKYILAPVGLLAGEHREVAMALLQRNLTAAMTI
jgi:uncharacterized protein (TIGR01319 family)